MNEELIRAKLNDILSRCRKINFSQVLLEEQRAVFEEVELYLMDDGLKDEVLLLEASVKGMTPAEKAGERTYKGKAFYGYAKIINLDYPAFKYSFYIARKPVEIFDKDKVRERIEGERDRWRNIEKDRLKKTIEAYEPPLTVEQVKKLETELEERLVIDEEKIDEVIEHWDDYDVAITTRAHCKIYPAIYFTLDTSSDYLGDDPEKRRSYYKKKDTHLRSGVPNLLWYKDDRQFNTLRANDRVSRIIQTHTPYCGTIYIKKIKGGKK